MAQVGKDADASSRHLILGTVSRKISEQPATMLLVAQLVAVLVYPYLDTSRAGGALLGLLSMCAIGLALMVVRRTAALSTIALTVGLTLGLAAVVLPFIEAAAEGHTWLTLLNATVHVLFYAYVSYALLHHMLGDGDITRDDLYATGAAFTIVAWAFAYVYVIVVTIWPGSLSSTHAGPQSFFELLFFSFSNLTSCGLSDILPTESHSRSIVMVEQVVGVMYVALVVARMVGLKMRSPHSE